jgi:predicted MFS family arabinose efflux permease
LTRRERRLLLAILGFLTFSSVYANIVISPVITQLAAEFGVTTGTAGLVAAAYGAPGILIAILSGPYSDRFGRKRFLVGGAMIMGVFTLLGSFVNSFGLLLFLRAIAGAGASVIFPNVNATLGDNFPYRERGRAISTVIGFNTMASVVGIPVAGIVAEATSWRVSLALVGLLAIAAAALLLFQLRPAQIHVSESRVFELYHTILKNRSAVAAIISSLLGGLYWFTWVTYLVVFFEDTFGLTQGTASTYALTMGLGVFIGSQVGGRIGDRIGHRPVVASAILVSGVLLLLQTNVALPLLVTSALNLVLSAVIGARFATNSTLLTEQVPEARGTLLALSGATGSLSIVGGAAIGGLLIDLYGFWALGVFCMGAALLSSLIVLRFVREEPIDLEMAPA